MTTSVLSFQARRAARLARPAEADDRMIRIRVGLAWALVFLNVVTFYKGTWNQLPLIIPIPSKIGQLMTQGALPVALLLAWSVNRRMVIRPNVFLSLLTLLLIEAFISALNPNGHMHRHPVPDRPARRVRGHPVAALRRSRTGVTCCSSSAHLRCLGVAAGLGAARPARVAAPGPGPGPALR